MILLFLVLSILVFCCSAYAQEERYPVIIEDYATLRFNQTHGGRNLEFSYMRRDGKHGFKAGLNIHLDRKVKDNQGHAYKDRLLSNKPWEHLGINFGLERSLLSAKYSDINLSGFFNIEAFCMGFRQDKYRLFLSYHPDFLFVLDSYYISKPTLHIDYILGLSLSIKMYENIYLSMTGGYGLFMTFNYTDQIMNGPGLTSTEVSSQRWSIGINCRLGKKTVQRLYY